MKSTRRLIAPVVLAVIALFLGPGAVAVTSPSQACISTPEQFVSAWESRSARCVSRQLLGTVHVRGAKRPYPKGFWRAWAVGNSGLENFLTLNARYGSDPGQVGLGVLSLVGFPGLEQWDTPVDISVYQLPASAGVRIPTFATWFQLLDGRWTRSTDFPRGSQRDLIRAYSTLESDAVGAFESVTGCSREQLLAGSEFSRAIGCSDTFLETMQALGPSPYGRGTTRECISRFESRYDGERDAASLRAVLLQCQDAGFLFTGVGWTYNTYANPLYCGSAAEQSIRQRYTEPEFVVPNVPFRRMPAVAQVPLELSAERGALQSGYC